MSTRRNVPASIAPFHGDMCPHGRRVGYRVDVEKCLAALACEDLEPDMRRLIAGSVMHVLNVPMDVMTPDEYADTVRALHEAGLLPVIGDRAMMPTPGMWGLTHDEAARLAREAEDRIRAERRSGR